MMLPSPTDLGHFLEVASTLNLSRAAERLGVTQPTLSQSMKRLEHNLGQQLLIRSKSGVALSKTGEKLVVHARALLDDWEKLKEDSQKDSEQVRGKYSIGLHASVALYTTPHFSSKLLRKYPSLEFKFTHDLSRRITEDVISFKIDYGIVVNPVSHPDLVIKELFKDEVSFWRSKKINSNNDLESEDKVLVVEPDLNQTQDLLVKLGKKSVNFKRIVTSSNLEVIKSLILDGSGIGIIPGRVVGDEKKKLERLDQFSSFKDRICLVFRADMQKNVASRKLAAEMRELLSEN